jgi:tRNA (guanine-N7-)-methyltransferase
VVKNKLKKFAQINSFSNVVQPEIKFPATNFPYKGRWNSNFFRNNNPIILEIGCGKGEYTIGLAKAHPDKNFIGIDIKGDRIWKGAKEALEEGIFNAAFLRIQAERINYFFAQDEVSGIWITFPDPQLRGSRKKKRLTSPQFLNRYYDLLKPSGLIHLKTDSKELFEFTHEVIQADGHTVIYSINDLYDEKNTPEPLLKDIQTYYERMHISKGISIKYLCFKLKTQSS